MISRAVRALFMAALSLAAMPDAVAQTFAPGVSYATASTPRRVIVADVNGDGIPDLVAINQSSDTVSVFIGAGAGVFAAGVQYATGDQPDNVAAADLNGDGRLDLVVPNASSGNVSVFLGNGDGTFAAKVDYPTGFTPLGLALADITGDGELDIVLTMVSSNLLLILPGNGDGTFAAGLGVPTGVGPNAVVAVDLNGDGRPDAVNIASVANAIEVRLNNGASLGAPQGHATATDPSNLIAADLDGDGRMDLAVTTRGSDMVSVLLGNGDGTFQPRIDLPTGDSPEGVAAGDLDRDGNPDLVTAADGGPDSINIHRGNGDGTFAAPTTLAVPGANPYDVRIADLDGDGRLDIVGTAFSGSELRVFLNTTAVPPQAPTAVMATSGDGQLNVAFTPPTDAASLPLIDFTATCGATSVTGAGSPIVVAPLVNGTVYACTVTARNANGTSVPSAPSASATPAAAAVTSFTGPTATGSGTATVSFTGGGAACAFAPQGTGPLQSAFFIAVEGHPKSPPAGSAPPALLFPHGLLDFVLVNCTPGAGITFTVTYPAALPAGTQYWKYGPTAANPAPHWYLLPAAIAGATASFSITDGGLGDDDLVANGTIVDQGGPGIPAGGGPVPVPTLSEWGVLLLTLLMLAAALRGGRLGPAGRSRR